MTREHRRFTLLRRDRRGATALEFALVFPVIILFVFGMIAAYSLISCRRAMDFGIEKALRFAAVHGGSGVAPVSSAYAAAAGVVWTGVGTGSVVSVTPSTYTLGDTVTVSATYNWVAPAGMQGADSTTLFTSITLSASGSMRVVN